MTTQQPPGTSGNRATFLAGQKPSFSCEAARDASWAATAGKSESTNTII